MYRILIFLLYSVGVLSSPTTKPSFVAVSTTSTTESEKKDASETVIVPKIYEMNVYSNVSNRFATTVITSKVRNLGESAQEATFSVVLPDSAYITGFTMEIGGKNYTAYIKEKEEAKKDYDTAVSQGRGAAHVAVSARDSNRFTVSVNVEPQSKAVFYLYYEELLKRKQLYELVINIHPKQPVPNLNVQVLINETAPLSTIKTPPLRSGNDIRKIEGDLDPRATITKLDSKSALVQFSPTEDKQKEYAQLLGTDKEQGFSGQFVVQYDVERDSSGGEILVKDGYFVHFFAPDIKPLPKHIIFVLDTSGSMGGNRIKQLKEAMSSIFGELKQDDLFHLVEFNTNVIVWNLNEPTQNIKLTQTGYGATRTDINLSDIVFPNAFTANPDNIKEANSTVDAFQANGGTNIYEALRVAIRLAKDQKAKPDDNNRQPLIMFLTDGDPTVGITNSDDIISKLSEINEHIPIFSLSFGNGADRKFLQKLSLRNDGFARHIYEAADSSLQLHDFYKQISSPILSNVTFKYADDARKLTRTSFPTYFGGSEIIICGIIGRNFEEDRLPRIFGWGVTGHIQLEPRVASPIGDMERLWAYITVQQLLEGRETSKNKTENEKKALDIALKYSFVTPLTSLVVVKPNETEKAVATEEAVKKPIQNAPGYPVYGAPGYPVYAVARSGIPILRMGGAVPQRFNIGIRAHDVPVNVDLGNTKLNQLMSALTWLSSIYSSSTDSLTLSKGSYKLGLDKQVDETAACSNAPNATSGHCTLLHNCKKSHAAISTLDSYMTHFCAIESYAGVCCPT